MGRLRRNRKANASTLQKNEASTNKGPKLTHLSAKSVSKQTKKVQDMNRKALTFISNH